MAMQATTIHMARGCVVTIGNTWDQSHMLFAVLYSWREYTPHQHGHRSPTKLTSTQGRSHARSCHRLSTRHPHRHYRLHTASWRAQAPPATSTGRSSGMTVRSTARRSDRTATWATFSARSRLKPFLPTRLAAAERFAAESAGDVVTSPPEFHLQSPTYTIAYLRAQD